MFLTKLLVNTTHTSEAATRPAAVTVRKDTTLAVCTFLVEHGFAIADQHCIVIDHRHCGGWPFVNILYADQSLPPPKHFFGMIEGERQRVCIGKLWFDNSKIGAVTSKWVFQAYCSTYAPLVREISDKLHAQFNAEIEVIIVRDDIVFERFMS